MAGHVAGVKFSPPSGLDRAFHVLMLHLAMALSVCTETRSTHVTVAGQVPGQGDSTHSV
jgi:hypothetical protein